MKVLFATNPKISNPFTRTLVEGLHTLSPKDVFTISLDAFWENDVYEYDVIHIMFPHELLSLTPKRTFEDVEKRINEILKNGIKIVSTCHNYAPHLSDTEGKNVYDLVYSRSGMIFHFGDVSKNKFIERFPYVENVLLPHHVYDTLYKSIPDEKESRMKYDIKENAKILLCFGVIRNESERAMLINLSYELKKHHIKLWVPSFYRVYRRKRIFDDIKYLYYKLKYKHIKMQMGYISDEDLPYIFAASDVVLIPRLKILNSGNVPLAMYFGKVIVGPDVGNVGSLLSLTNNYCFDVNDERTIYSQILDAFNSHKSEKGEENRKYAMQNLSTLNIASNLLNYYYGYI